MKPLSCAIICVGNWSDLWQDPAPKTREIGDINSGFVGRMAGPDVASDTPSSRIPVDYALSFIFHIVQSVCPCNYRIAELGLCHRFIIVITASVSSV